MSQENLVKLTLESNATLKDLKKVVEKVKGRRQWEQNQETWLEAEGIRDTWGGTTSSFLIKWMFVLAFCCCCFYSILFFFF